MRVYVTEDEELFPFSMDMTQFKRYEEHKSEMEA